MSRCIGFVCFKSVKDEDTDRCNCLAEMSQRFCPKHRLLVYRPHKLYKELSNQFEVFWNENKSKITNDNTILIQQMIKMARDIVMIRESFTNAYVHPTSRDKGHEKYIHWYKELIECLKICVPSDQSLNQNEVLNSTVSVSIEQKSNETNIQCMDKKLIKIKTKAQLFKEQEKKDNDAIYESLKLKDNELQRFIQNNQSSIKQEVVLTEITTRIWCVESLIIPCIDQLYLHWNSNDYNNEKYWFSAANYFIYLFIAPLTNVLTRASLWELYIITHSLGESERLWKHLLQNNMANIEGVKGMLRNFFYWMTDKEFYALLNHASKIHYRLDNSTFTNKICQKHHKRFNEEIKRIRKSEPDVRTFTLREIALEKCKSEVDDQMRRKMLYKLRILDRKFV